MTISGRLETVSDSSRDEPNQAADCPLVRTDREKEVFFTIRFEAIPKQFSLCAEVL